MSDFNFPINYTPATPAAADYISKNTKITSCLNLFRGATTYYMCPLFDTSNVTNMNSMFYNCSYLVAVPSFDTSNVTTMSSTFNGCSALLYVPLFDTSNVTTMNSMLSNCSKLTTVPLFDTSNCTNMSSMLNGCSNITLIPKFDMSKVTTLNGMFYGCSKLTVLPDFNTVKLQNFGNASYNSWLYSCTALKKIGIVDCDSVTNIAYFFGGAANNSITEFGGCRNLGKASSLSGTNGSYFMSYAPNLTYESIMNIINGLYDRATAGYSVLTLKLHANHLAKLSDADIAIATNKGWTLS